MPRSSPPTAVTEDGGRAVTLLIGSKTFNENKVDRIVADLMRDLR